MSNHHLNTSIELPLLTIMSLRRSVFGSLRSVPPFTTQKDDQFEPLMPGRSPAVSISESITSQSSRYTAYTPSSLLRRATTTSPTPESASRFTRLVLRLEEESRPPPPEFDRDVDLVATETEIQVDSYLIYGRIAGRQRTSGSAHPLFALPPSIKQRVYSFCFPFEERKITLSPYFATKAVFPEEYFASPWYILQSVSGGIQSFRALRHGLLTFFWTEYKFHVTLNEFSGPKFSPLSNVWLLEYLDMVQRLTIEVDFTRFGCSQLQDAKKFGYNLTKTRSMLTTIVQGLGERPVGSTMSELHLMCRRYAGFRPLNNSWVDNPTDRYCPEDVLNLCDSVMALRGILNKCQVSGFPLDYSQEILNSLFGDGKPLPAYTTPSEKAWPGPQQTPLPPSEPPTPASLTSMEFGLKLHHNISVRSFTEEIEDEMSKYAPSTQDAPSLQSDDNYTLSPFPSYDRRTGEQRECSRRPTLEENYTPILTGNEPTTEQRGDSKSPTLDNYPVSPTFDRTISEQREDSHTSTLDNYSSSPNYERTTAGQREDSQTPTLDNYTFGPSYNIMTEQREDVKIPTLEDQARAYQELISDMMIPEMTVTEPTLLDCTPEIPLSITPPNETTTPTLSSTPRFSPLSIEIPTSPLPSTPHLTPVQDEKNILTPLAGRSLHPRTPSRIPRSMTDPSPKTPNKMNELNEQDPAFIRALSAMRSLEGVNRRHTLIASPKTPPNSSAGKSPTVSKRKYLSFVNRLRGCVQG